MRWWDGTQWTDNVQAAPAGAVPTALRAPEGTSISSPWIWIIVGVGVIPILALLFLDFGAFSGSVSGTGSVLQAELSLFEQPAYWFAAIGGWVLSLLNILWAYLDWRLLQRNGVPRPFHFAFILFTLAGAGYWVYLVGRTVVLRQRTGQTAMGPVWGAIAVVALALVVGISVGVRAALAI